MIVIVMNPISFARQSEWYALFACETTALFAIDSEPPSSIFDSRLDFLYVTRC